MSLPVTAVPVQIQRRAQPAVQTGPWTTAAVLALLQQPFMALVQQAHAVHAQHWPRGDIELASLLSVKTGGCPEDCAYCPQSIHHATGIQAQKLMAPEEVLAAARAAQAAGATRFCMGAAWRSPTDRDVDKVAELVRGVRSLGCRPAPRLAC